MSRRVDARSGRATRRLQAERRQRARGGPARVVQRLASSRPVLPIIQAGTRETAQPEAVPTPSRPVLRRTPPPDLGLVTETGPPPRRAPPPGAPADPALAVPEPAALLKLLRSALPPDQVEDAERWVKEELAPLSTAGEGTAPEEQPTELALTPVAPEAVATEPEPADSTAEPEPEPEPAPVQGAFTTASVAPMAADAKRQRLAHRRYTVFVVPDGGRGPLRQVELSLVQLRMVATVAALVLVFAVIGVAAAVLGPPASRSRKALLEENIVLKARMQDVERKLSEVDAELRRLRLYNSQLEELPLDGIPGFGPVAAEDAGNLLWLGRVKPNRWHGDPGGDWQPGMPMEEPPGDEVAPSDLTAAEARALELTARTERILEGVRLVEDQAGKLVETAQEWRWRQESMPSNDPCPACVYTSDFGWRRAPFSRRWKFHTGVDLAAPTGTPIYAAGAGVVERAEWSSGYGRLVVIDHGEGVVSRYAHTSRIYVQPGQSVERGQRIASVGTTGRTTGPHLHFEVYVDGVAVDPAEFLRVP